ncbi:MAG: cyanoexosortase A [Moorea sp. SIO3I7]|nr:cyanoexosortase A [Moorena sp. SIO3I7]
MKAARFSLVKQLNIPALSLLAIGAALIAIHLTLNLRAEKSSHLALSIVFWLAACSTLWDKRYQLKLGSGIVPFLFGALLIAGILIKSGAHPSEKFLGFSPFISVFGLALLASGFRGLKQYWQELLILFTLGVPKLLLPYLPNITPITAKFSAFLLWYSGANVVLQDSYIILPKGSIEVVPSCSGLNLIIYMLGLAVIVLVMFPTSGSQKIIVPIVAATLGFIVNGIRIAILAHLAAPSSQAAFDYWHSQEGALIFVMISVILFGTYCLFMLQQSEP